VVADAVLFDVSGSVSAPVTLAVFVTSPPRSALTEDCVEQCLKTLELDRHNVGVYFFLGHSYEQLGRHEEAVEASRH
jgi:hypothetical protein